MRSRIVLIVLFCMLWPHIALANTIIVDGTTCTLPEAIEAANTNSAFAGCTTGGGASDTLRLTAPTYSLSAIVSTGDYDDNNATPSITTTIVISGGTGVGAIVQRTGSNQMRLFHVAETGDLTLANVIVRNGIGGTSSALSGGGGIWNDGKLTLLKGQIIANSGDGISNGGTMTLTSSEVYSNIGGGIFNRGTMTLTNSEVYSNTAFYKGAGILNWGTMTLTNSEVYFNTADEGGGISNGGTMTLTNSTVYSNIGGGISNEGTMTLTNSEVNSNTASSLGGGIVNWGTMTLTNSKVNSNTGAHWGGGIYDGSSSTAKVTASEVNSNTASDGGGGIYNRGTSTVEVTASEVNSNTAYLGSGGGIYNEYYGTVEVTASEINSNTAAGGGGGVFNKGMITLTNSSVNSNTSADGGGISNEYYSTVEVTDSEVNSNTASHQGGGISNAGTMTLTNSKVNSNTASDLGGGIYNGDFIDHNNDVSTATISATTFIANQAKEGGAIYQETPYTSTISRSCIVDNSDTAVYSSGPEIVAKGNWWGASDGPSGVGPGSGDSVTNTVTFSHFLTAAPDGCLAQVSFSKRVSSATPLLPGEPVSFTITITNEGILSARKLEINDALPLSFIVSNVVSSPSIIKVTQSSFVISQLLPAQVATITYLGKVDPANISDTPVTNTATLSSGSLGILSANAPLLLTLPKLNWSADIYTVTVAPTQAAVTSNNITVTLLLTPANPYAGVSVEVVYTSSAASAAGITEAIPITIPPGNSSQSLLIPISVDASIEPQTIQLGMQKVEGASLGSRSTATISVAKPNGQGVYLPLIHP